MVKVHNAQKVDRSLWTDEKKLATVRVEFFFENGSRWKNFEFWKNKKMEKVCYSLLFTDLVFDLYLNLDPLNLTLTPKFDLDPLNLTWSDLTFLCRRHRWPESSDWPRRDVQQTRAQGVKCHQTQWHREGKGLGDATTGQNGDTSPHTRQPQRRIVAPFIKNII